MPRWIGAGAVALLLLFASAAQAQQDASVSFQVDSGHTGFLQGGSLDAPPLTTRWQVKLGTSMSTPLVADGRVFVASYDTTHAGATIAALDVASGVQLWWRPMNGRVELALDGSRLFALNDDGFMAAIDAATGATLWTRSLREPFSARAPVARDGIVYAAQYWSGGAIYALDATDGHELWHGSQLWDGGAPAVDGTGVYVSDGYACASAGWDRRDGHLLFTESSDCWTLRYRAVATGSWLVADNRLVDPSDGALVDDVVSSNYPAFAGNTEVALNGTTLQGRDARRGNGLWQFAADGKLSGSPLIVDNTVYSGSTNGKLYAVDLASGTQVWSTTLATTSYSTTTIGNPGMAAGQGILLVPAGGTLIALASAPPRPGLDVQIWSGPDGPTTDTSADFTFGATGTGFTTWCRLDGGSWDACEALVHLDGLTDGPHTFEVQTRDLSGTPIGLAARGWAVDTEPPLTTISTGPTDPYRYGYASFTFASTGATRTECSLDDAPWKGCTSSMTYSQLADGRHVFRVRGVDGLGNTAEPASWAWTVDSVSPHLTIDAGPASGTTSRSARFEFHSNEDPVQFTCQLDYAPSESCTSPNTWDGLSTGSHLVTVQATDRAGNQGWTSWSWTINDPPPPSDSSRQTTETQSVAREDTPAATKQETSPSIAQDAPPPPTTTFSAPSIADPTTTRHVSTYASLKDLADTVRSALVDVRFSDLLKPGALRAAFDTPEAGVVTLTLTQHGGRVLAQARLVVRPHAVALVGLRLTSRGRALARSRMRRVSATLRIAFAGKRGQAYRVTRGVAVGSHAH